MGFSFTIFVGVVTVVIVVFVAVVVVVDVLFADVIDIVYYVFVVVSPCACFALINYGKKLM